MDDRFKLGVLIGTRPGIIKMAPVYHAVRAAGQTAVLVHSGQHFSFSMDQQIMADVELPEPDYRYLRPEDCVTHAEQTAFMLTRIEQALMDAEPDLFFVCGDANTNLAGALAARKLGIAVGHVEAGLRSHDFRMPEEHNRRMIDHISSLLYAPGEESLANLRKECVPGEAHVVGNTVADSALRFKPASRERNGKVLITLHREENVDDPAILRNLLAQIGQIIDFAGKMGEFLVHPRTRKRIDDFGLWEALSGSIETRETVGYRDMLRKIFSADFLITDSGGLQEEACILGTPCYTVRKTTERPETVDCGANVVLGTEEPFSRFKANKIPEGASWTSPYGEGDASDKIVSIAIDYLSR